MTGGSVYESIIAIKRVTRVHIQEVSGVAVARTQATGRVQPDGAIFAENWVESSVRFVLDPRSMPMHMVIQQEASTL